MTYQIFYYDVLKETVEMPSREAAIRYMGARYGGMVGITLAQYAEERDHGT